MIIKANTSVVLHSGKPAVKIQGTYFFVDNPVGTMGMFLAHKFDQFAYLREDSWEERSERNHYLGVK
jgi:hypothetical protein